MFQSSTLSASDVSVTDPIRKRHFMQNVGNNMYIPHCLVHVEQIMPWAIIYTNKVSENNAFEYWASFIPDTNLVAGMKKLF